MSHPFGIDPRPGTRPLDHTAYAGIGMQLVDARADEVVVSFPITNLTRDIHGRCALGAIALAAESAASTAAGIAAGPDMRAFGVELNISYLDVPSSGTVTARVTAASITPDTHVWNIVVTCDECHDGPIATGRCLLSIVPVTTSVDTSHALRGAYTDEVE